MDPRSKCHMISEGFNPVDHLKRVTKTKRKEKKKL